MRARLLLLSVGSLVGHNVLEALQGRRDRVELIGTNLLADAPGNFRCDRCYLVPPTKAPGFGSRMHEILANEQPDLILPGRDDDVVFLAGLQAARPELAANIPCGSPAAAAVITSKLASSRFAAEHGLVFADSVLLAEAADLAAVEDLGRTAGWPLIAKRPAGFGSQGVQIVTDAESAARLLGHGTWLLQEYLDPPAELPTLLAQWQLGPPLFFQIPETSQYACQTVIAPDGAIAPLCLTLNTNILGRTEYVERVDLPELEAVGQAWARAMADAGWRGSLNLQCKRDRNGAWKIFELGGRMTGSTSARLLLGYDELGLLLGAFRPELGFADLSRQAPQGAVRRLLVDAWLPWPGVDSLQQHGYWEKSEC